MVNNDCPLCHHPLGAEQKNELDKELQKLIKKESSSEIQQVEAGARQNQERLKKELEDIKKNKETELKKIKEEYETGKEKDKAFLQNIFKEQLEQTKKLLEEQASKDKKQLKDENKELKGTFEKLQSKIDEEAEKRSKRKIDETEQKHKQALEEKDVQLSRFRREADDLKRQVDDLNKAGENKSGEIKGTAGEAVLFKDLREAFPHDTFKCQNRGQMEADIVQSITDAGRRVPMPIVYDNKEKTKITQLDISKAKKYQTIHQTKYVLLVYSEMPRGTEEHLISEKDGILIVHRSVVIEVVRQLRKFLIELFKTQVSEIGRGSKEAMLFRLIKSPKFESFIRGVENDVTDLNQLQDKEEKGHQKIWALRKKLVENIETARRTTDAEISAILQDNREPIPIDISAQRVLKNKRKKNSTI